MTLYNLRRTGDGYTMVKWDANLNIEAVYELTPLKTGLQSLACNCPAGHRHTCRHRKMVPIFIAKGAVDTQQFYDYEHQFWQQPIPTEDENVISAEKAAKIGEKLYPYTEEDCPSHVASENDAKVCANCGLHIDSLRPDDDDGEPSATKAAQLSEQEKLDNECDQCKDPNCGLYGCMKHPPSHAGEGPEPSPLAADNLSSPSVSGRSQPAPKEGIRRV